MKMQEIKDTLQQLHEKNEWFEELRKDERASVQKLVVSFERRLEKQQAIKQSYYEKVAFDQSFVTKENSVIVGIDEAGRGPLAGPVVTAAVAFTNYSEALQQVHDSKQLSKKQREMLVDIIKSEAEHISIHVQSEARIDEINIYEATKESMLQSLLSLPVTPDAVLVDAMKLNYEGNQHSIIKGDAKSLAIAAASIIAKTVRDELMEQAHKIYPQYGFLQNAGYGTKQHLEALQKFGPCEMHRKTFEPIKSMLHL